MIPYGRHLISDDDIRAVTDVLRSDWLTTGPKIKEFENLFAETVAARFAVAVSSGTAALHAAMFTIGIKPGDEVIVPSMTFAATANCIVYQGGKPVFADVNPDTLLLDPAAVETKITSATKALITVDYAGQPGNYEALHHIAREHGIFLVADACHSLGAEYNGHKVGSLAHMSTFSFHPVKHITTGEGGMITTDSEKAAHTLRKFRNHGINNEHQQRGDSWYYEMVELGYNYRLSDIQCALGISQLPKNTDWLLKRQKIAARYDEAFDTLPGISPLKRLVNVKHAYHLYVVRLNASILKQSRKIIFQKLRQNGIGVNVHYIPVHLHPFYRKKFGTSPGDCPVAEQAYEEIISLPIFPGLQEIEQEEVIAQIIKITGED